jgi:hypothetical protein
MPSLASARSLLLAVLALAPLTPGCAAVLELPIDCEFDRDCPQTAECSDGVCVTLQAAGGEGEEDRPDEPANPNGDDEPLIINNTPYELVRSDANKCIDVRAASLVEYDPATGFGDITQFDCNDTSAQRFWALERQPGVFAFVNALSARCISLENDLIGQEDNIIQRACSFSAGQLWRPVESGGFVRIESAGSKFVLEVRGTQSVENGLKGTDGDIQQSTFIGSPDQLWKPREAFDFSFIAFDVIGVGSIRVDQNANFAALAGAAAGDDNQGLRVVPGLADPLGLSFESKAFPGRFLRHRGGEVFAEVNDNSALFKDDATFFARAPLGGDGREGLHSLESKNFPGGFLRIVDGKLRQIPTTAADPVIANAATIFFRQRN